MDEMRDAVEVAPWTPGAGAPPYVHYYGDHDVLRVNVRIAGSMHRAVATERRDYRDGRRALHLALWPAMDDGRRRIWVWWDPGSVRVSSHATSPAEAEVREGDARRVRHSDEPRKAPAVQRFSGRPTQVRVRVGGEWHDAEIHSRLTYEDGRQAVQCRVIFIEGGWPIRYWRYYWWDTEAFEPR